jgi:hypothetical protein
MPVIEEEAAKFLAIHRQRQFTASDLYWERRYAHKGSSGAGSYGPLAAYKASVLNTFVVDWNVRSVIEFGCGDGNQLSLGRYPKYIGLDVSATAVRTCIDKFSGTPMSFFRYDPSCFVDNQQCLRAELALSLDVIYHLVEDRVFDSYMKHLFGAAERFVGIYSSDREARVHLPHIRERRFSEWIGAYAPGWELIETVTHPHSELLLGQPPVAFYFYGSSTSQLLCVGS